MSKETAALVHGDSKLMEEVAEWMRGYVWEVNTCGNDGKLAMEKIRELAPKALKVLVNYI